jgi:signal transduction histidine kinase
MRTERRPIIGLLGKKQDTVKFISEALTGSSIDDFTLLTYQSNTTFIKDLSETDFHLIIVEFPLKNKSIPRLISRIKKFDEEIPITIITEPEFENKAIDLLNNSIETYFVKNECLKKTLPFRISKIIENSRTRKKLNRLESVINSYSEHLEKFRVFNRDLIQSIPMGIIVTDSANILVNINETAKEILGISDKIIDKDELRYYNLIEGSSYNRDYLIRKMKNKKIKNLIQIAFDFHRKEESLELTIDYKYTPITLDINTKVLDNKIYSKREKKDVSVKITVFKDITKYRKMEEQLPELKKIASLGTLSAGIAHEIRNPLTSMSMFCSYIEDTFDENDDRKRVMEKVVSEINRLESLVKNISSFAKNIPINNTMINLYQLIENTLFFVNQHIKKKNIVVDNRVEEDFMVFADLERIKQVLINVFINSINAMGEGGTLSILAWKDADTTSIQVKDTGSGIPDELINKIYEPFFTTNSQSSGLGLSIVQKIISQHKGEVRIANRKDSIKGTDVTLILPRITKE